MSLSADKNMAMDTERDMDTHRDMDTDSVRDTNLDCRTCSFSSLSAAFSNWLATSFN